MITLEKLRQARVKCSRLCDWDECMVEELNKPDIIEGYVNVYPEGSSKGYRLMYPSTDKCRKSAGNDAIRIAVHVREVTDE